MTNKEASNVLRLFANLIEINGLPEERILTFRKAYEQAISELESDTRPQGKWEYNQYDGNPNIGNWHCSECRHIVFGGHSQKPYYNFCPRCGADMRGKEE